MASRATFLVTGGASPKKERVPLAMLPGRRREQQQEADAEWCCGGAPREGDQGRVEVKQLVAAERGGAVLADSLPVENGEGRLSRRGRRPDCWCCRSPCTVVTCTAAVLAAPPPNLTWKRDEATWVWRGASPAWEW